MQEELPNQTQTRFSKSKSLILKKTQSGHSPLQMANLLVLTTHLLLFGGYCLSSVVSRLQAFENS